MSRPVGVPPAPASELPLRLTVERLVHGGHGLARPGGEVILLVGEVLPGEEVLARRLPARAGVAWARVEEVLVSSAQRVPPSCPDQDRCGGCQLRHAAPAAQLELKLAACREALGRQGVVLPATTPGAAVGPADGWRCRVRYQLVAPPGEPGGPPRFGLSGRRGRPLAIAACRQAHPLAETARHTVEELLAAAPPREGRRWSELRVEVQPGPPPAVVLTLRGRGGGAAGRELAADLGRGPWVQGVRLVDARGAALVRGEARLHLPLRLPTGVVADLVVPSGSFFQANQQGNPALVAAVPGLGRPQPDEPVLELYAGAGNLTLPLAACGAPVLAVEGDWSAVRGCLANARRAGLPGVTAVAQDLRRGLPPEGRARPGGFPLVVLDPPRGGAAELLPDLVRLQPTRIVYVSCDPPAMARDLARLQHAGFRLTALELLDLFPGTFHLEAVALLER